MQQIPASQRKPKMAQRSLWFGLLLLLSAPAMADPPCEKTLRWNDDPPLSMELPDGSVGGIYVELNDAAMERLGCKTRLRKLPWARALKELELGRLDILPGAFRLPEREAYAHFSGAVLPPSRNILFARQDAIERWPITRLPELSDLPFRLGAQIDVQYGPDYALLMSDPSYADSVLMVNNRSNLWNMISKGRIDGVIADEHTGTWEIRQLGLSRLITATDVVVSTDAAEVAFSKRSNDQNFVYAYAATIRELVSDGSYQRIVARYLTP
ncbi:substrate-binding periplasmic protein [Halopseudomonas aestusnigri]|uniref:Polar amino acid transport system substrate-binding protein n=1 Tax=Halopseudomonas aestusnigri TaxID=857252 RepID=A0AAQ1G5C4_9GAMM|nr:transporter substrate-binding domain-containing protein [Halopseudomonas aestusnigri]OWL91436.1 ABC transporter substrate-binding protein [Halopseudomonas aestusnigri]SEF72699.1 polar amino acid transport system substrate-binding protein [Halopseudomonas aestusnigri]